MFDPNIRSLGGHDITAADMNALEPFRKIRVRSVTRWRSWSKVTGLWSLPAALKIAPCSKSSDPRGAKDLMRADDIDGLAELRRGTTCPILASEYLATRYEYKPTGEAGRRHRDDRPRRGRAALPSAEVGAMAEVYSRPVRDARLHRAVSRSTPAFTSR